MRNIRNLIVAAIASLVAGCGFLDGSLGPANLELVSQLADEVRLTIEFETSGGAQVIGPSPYTALLSGGQRKGVLLLCQGDDDGGVPMTVTVERTADDSQELTKRFRFACGGLGVGTLQVALDELGNLTLSGLDGAGQVVAAVE